VVLTATDDPKVDVAAWHEAREGQIPINVADDPSKCDFIMPSILRRGDLTVAISTGGASPALAARLRRRISAIVGPEYGKLVDVLGRVRSRLKESVPDDEERKQLHYRIVDSIMLYRILELDIATVESRIDDIIEEASKGLSQKARPVYIVGAGPGDPGLITSRGLDLLRMADVILHDRLIDTRLLEQARSGAEVIDVGKRVGDGGRMQDFIQETLIERAKRGQIVCRLKGGDPFVFGRGGEEALALTEAGIPFEIISGVTSAIAAPAAAGIPVTHRDIAHSFMVMTGSRADDASPEEWAGARSVVSGGGTVVVLMGLSRLNVIVRRLTKAGCGPETPAAVISRGTWIEQDVRVGTLETIESLSKGVVSPAVIVFGVTVRERERLAEVRTAMSAGTA
jgi:uroporphyrin-III C-methyltransferase/precorrin-2 dehydrogenase/sirohydrochlorin ferrochelatase